jgi:hypothetical protein
MVAITPVLTAMRASEVPAINPSDGTIWDNNRGQTRLTAANLYSLSISPLGEDYLIHAQLPSLGTFLRGVGKTGHQPDMPRLVSMPNAPLHNGSSGQPGNGG